MPLITGNRAVERAYIGATELNAIMHAGVNLLDGTVLPRKGRTFLMSKSSLILEEGAGGPTWSRATKAWGFNERGYLEELASGCAFFGGARLVRNLVPTPSNTLAVAGTKTVTLTQSATLQFSMGAGAGTATFSGTGGSSGTLAAGASRVSVNKTVTAGTFIVTASVDALVDLSIVDVTNYDASYVPEYVSVGVVASPYFGAGIDGAKYFETDWQGAPLPAASLLGFRREAAATNNLLGSRDFFINWTPGVVAGTLFSDDFSSYANTAAMTAAGWTAAVSTTQTLDAAAILITNAGAVYGSSSKTITTEVGKSYLVTFAFTKTTANCGAYVANTATAPSIDRLNNVSATVTGAYSLVFTATATTTYLVFGLNSNTVGHAVKIDDVLVKESKVTVTKATGLDGIANTATTLTATAADAVILQPISLASAARCASAYVKRRTGTGTISFTQDGGSTWTDITSQINGSTWSRVQITSTLANPSVGFKISTLGDAIDVDCVQNEAGAVATSPIVTTTATVTRNADSLTYQTASNIDFAVGTLYGEIQTNIGAATRYIAWIGTSYSGLIDTALTSWRAYDGTTIANKTGLSNVSSAKRKRVVSWGGAGLTSTGEGLAPETVAFDGSFGDGATIAIGTNANGYIGPVAIYNYQMTDAELQALTT